MAKRGTKRTSGPGRGRRGAPIDPVTKRFIKTTTTTTTEVTPPSTPPAAVPVAPPIITPETIKQEVSGFRKALIQVMQDLGADQSEVQDALLDGLRETAEKLVAENEKIFGKRSEKTVEQSAAYEVFEGVVRLGESAAKAKTVAEKRKILQRLRTYKRVAGKVFEGGDTKQKEISKKLLDMIESIEKPLSKESGRRAAIRESVSEYAKTIPERMARKIPLVGGLVGGYLQRRREKREEEAEALSSLTEEISRAGRSSLYGRKTDLGTIEPQSIMPDISSVPSEVSPIPGGTRVSEMTKRGSLGFDRSSVQILSQLLSQVSDIKKLLFEQYDSRDKTLEEEEAKREKADESKDWLSRISGMFGRGRRSDGDGTRKPTESGMVGNLMNLLGMGGIAKTVTSIISTIGGVATSLGSIVGGIAAGVGTLAATAGGVVSSVAGMVGKAAVAAAPWVAAAGAGTAIGLGAAYGVNKGIDAILGTNLSEKMFEPETWTFSDVKKDIEREELNEKIETKQKEVMSSPEYVSAAKGDWRRLPDLVQSGKISGTEALQILSNFETQNGRGEDTEFIRQRIKDLDPKAVEIPPLPEISTESGQIVPNVSTNTTQQYLNSLEQNREALVKETDSTTSTGGQFNSVIAPNTTNNNVSINTPPTSGTRNNDPTLKAAERATL